MSEREKEIKKRHSFLINFVNNTRFGPRQEPSSGARTGGLVGEDRLGEGEGEGCLTRRHAHVSREASKQGRRQDDT